MNDLIVKKLGRQHYNDTFDYMVQYTAERTEHSNDMLLQLEHEPVFSQGRHGRDEHILNPHQIPIFQSDRGGQVTYHGPGQAIIYFVCDIKRMGFGVKHFVETIEQSTLDLLAYYGINGHLIDQRPGVYVNNEKIASLGLRVKKGKTYHGLSINVDMDLTPFSYINPCGYQNLAMTQLKDFIQNPTLDSVFENFTDIFTKKMDYHIISSPTAAAS